MSKHSKIGCSLKVLSSPRTNLIIMGRSEDLEKFYFHYQSEALPHGESLQSFFSETNFLITSFKNIFNGCWGYTNMIPDKIS